MNAPPDRAIRVLVVDGNPFTLLGVSSALNLESDIAVIAEAGSGKDAIALFNQHQPDVLVIDGLLPDMHGTEVTREIKRDHSLAKVLMFSTEHTEEDFHRAVDAGVSGYLIKASSSSELIVAVRCLASGQHYFPKAVLCSLQQRRQRQKLSTRELEVLRHMAKGLPNKIIAAELGVSPETVKTFVGRILGKLDSEDRTQAVVTALKRGCLKIIGY